jgi:hypothetical protein
MSPSYAGINHGQLTLSGSAQALTAGVSDDVSGVVVKAHDGNAAKCYVGKSGVTAGNGFELGAGQAVTLNVMSQQSVFVIGTAADKVSWIATSPT